MLNRYFGSHALETLQDGRILSSRLGAYNDPFELMFSPKRDYTEDELLSLLKNRLESPKFVEVLKSGFPGFEIEDAEKLFGDENIREMLRGQMTEIMDKSLKSTVEAFDDRFRAICFSGEQTPANEVLMWSLYANSHQGWRLGFELDANAPNYELRKVDYESERVKIENTGLDLPEYQKKKLFDTIHTKSLSWQYENEYRLTTAKRLLTSEALPNGDMGYFFEFSPEQLKRIDLGLRSDEGVNEQIISLAREHYPSVELYRVVYHPSEFRLSYNKVE